MLARSHIFSLSQSWAHFNEILSYRSHIFSLSQSWTHFNEILSFWTSASEVKNLARCFASLRFTWLMTH